MELQDWLAYEALESDPERVSGAVVFKNTRLPVDAVVENVDAFMEVDGLSFDQAVAATLECFPSVPNGTDGIRSVLAFRTTHEHLPVS